MSAPLGSPERTMEFVVGDEVIELVDRRLPHGRYLEISHFVRINGELVPDRSRLLRIPWEHRSMFVGRVMGFLDVCDAPPFLRLVQS